jgi:hypothetical protein
MAAFLDHRQITRDGLVIRQVVAVRDVLMKHNRPRVLRDAGNLAPEDLQDVDDRVVRPQGQPVHGLSKRVHCPTRSEAVTDVDEDRDVGARFPRQLADESVEHGDLVAQIAPEIAFVDPQATVCAYPIGQRHQVLICLRRSGGIAS